MYTTRSRYADSHATQEGPNSRYIVIDRGNKMINHKELPLPHDKILLATHYGDEYDTERSYFLFIPVINQPLSSNRYYMIHAKGNYQGLACVSSTEEDMVNGCCGRTFIAGRKPRSLNPLDIYQQFEITLTSRYSINPFKAKSVAQNGELPSFLGQSWDFYIKPSLKRKIPEITEAAHGLNSDLRNRLPNFDDVQVVSRERTPPVVVGKWVCPFMFIREGKIKDQMKKSPFYEMTLEQSWERVFVCENTDGASSVAVNFVVPTEVVKVNGKDAYVGMDEAEGVLWCWSVDDQMQQGKVGLSLVIVERMIWEEAGVGWVNGNEKQVMVGKVETFTEEGNVCSSWRRYGCYVLVERFVLKRMDGNLVLTYEFMHTRQMKCKWE